jgi:hypothetical protein
VSKPPVDLIGAAADLRRDLLNEPNDINNLLSMAALFLIAASPGVMLPDCDAATAGWPLLFGGVHVLFLFSISDTAETVRRWRG